mmetsp:Transcript_8335/g.28567  ORF Transcript_8335/g.28567 Transcript_8335/m.28567 type:complete len:268 (-) Transcript_8335:66-869(-)
MFASKSSANAPSSMSLMPKTHQWTKRTTNVGKLLEDERPELRVRGRRVVAVRQRQQERRLAADLRHDLPAQVVHVEVEAAAARLEERRFDQSRLRDDDLLAAAKVRAEHVVVVAVEGPAEVRRRVELAAEADAAAAAPRVPDRVAVEALAEVELGTEPRRALRVLFEDLVRRPQTIPRDGLRRRLVEARAEAQRRPAARVAGEHAPGIDAVSDAAQRLAARDARVALHGHGGDGRHCQNRSRRERRSLASARTSRAANRIDDVAEVR